MSRGRPCSTDQGFHHRTENNQAVRGTQRGLHRTLRMRHQACDVSLAIADSRDIRGGTVRISGCIVGTISAGVAEDDLPVFLQLSKRGFVASVIPVAMRNGG